MITAAREQQRLLMTPPSGRRTTSPPLGTNPYCDNYTLLFDTIMRVFLLWNALKSELDRRYDAEYVLAGSGPPSFERSIYDRELGYVIPMWRHRQMLNEAVFAFSAHYDEYSAQIRDMADAIIDELHLSTVKVSIDDQRTESDRMILWERVVQYYAEEQTVLTAKEIEYVYRVWSSLFEVMTNDEHLDGCVVVATSRKSALADVELLHLTFAFDRAVAIPRIRLVRTMKKRSHAALQTFSIKRKLPKLKLVADSEMRVLKFDVNSMLLINPRNYRHPRRDLSLVSGLRLPYKVATADYNRLLEFYLEAIRVLSPSQKALLNSLLLIE